MPQKAPDSKNFCPKYFHLFATESLKSLCSDIMLSGFPSHIPADDSTIGSNEVFLFIKWNTTNLTDTTQFTLTTSDGSPKGSIYFQLFGKWDSTEVMAEAQNIVIGLANRKEIQSFVGAVKYPPRYLTVVVSQDDQLVNPVAVHIPDEEYKGDFCFRMRHIFNTENIIKHCLDAMLSSFPYPPDEFDTNEIILFIHDNMTSVGSTTQYVLTVGAPADPARGYPARKMLIQSFGVFIGAYGQKTQDLVLKLAEERSLQTFVGTFVCVSMHAFVCLTIPTHSGNDVHVNDYAIGAPTPPYRFFTLVLAASTEKQFDAPLVLHLPRVPGDFCTQNKDKMGGSNNSSDSGAMVKKCDEVVKKLRNFPWPVPVLNQRNYTNEVFVFINLEVDLLDLTQFGFNLARPGEPPATYIQCFGMWNKLSTDEGTAFVMNRDLVGLGNHSEYVEAGVEG